MADNKAVYNDLMARRQELEGYPPEPQPNYNGGAGDLGTENPTDDQLREAYNDTAYAMKYVGFAIQLAKFAVTADANFNLQGSLKSAKKKMEASDKEITQKAQAAEEVVNEIAIRGSRMDGLKEQLQDLQVAIAPKLAAVTNLNASFSQALSVMAAANSELQAAIAYSNSILRSNYPPGVKGTQAYTAAKKAAEAVVINKKLALDGATANAAEIHGDLTDARNEYNSMRNDGLALAARLEQNYNESIQLRSVLANRLRDLDGPIAARAEATRDVQKAMSDYKQELSLAFDLGQAAVGAQGIQQFFEFAAIGRYYSASAALFNSGLLAIFPYVAENGELAGVFGQAGWIPGIKLFGSALLRAAKIVEDGGSFMSYAEDLGEATLRTTSAARLIDSAGLIDFEGDSYTAFNQLVVLTGGGIDILGGVTTTVAPFIPVLVPITPALPALTATAREGTTGVFQTGVSMGYLAARNRLVSAPIGSGQISGAFLLLAWPFAVAGGVVNALIGDRSSGAAKNIRDMAESGSRGFRFSPTEVTIRPTDPDMKNPYGKYFVGEGEGQGE